MVDPHLAELRRAKSLRLSGMAYTGIGSKMGLPWQTVCRMVREANELRSQGKLYADLNAEEQDMYARPSMPRRLTVVTR